MVVEDGQLSHFRLESHVGWKDTVFTRPADKGKQTSGLPTFPLHVRDVKQGDVVFVGVNFSLNRCHFK
jgi:hypothetical protein